MQRQNHTDKTAMIFDLSDAQSRARPSTGLPVCFAPNQTVHEAVARRP
jgi:hypothetical protein